MDERGALGLAEAWELVSLRPARAAGLRTKGHIAAGYAADLLLVERQSGVVRLRSVLVGGREVANWG
jgi:alpha-D-ribose 1-methylphosphonate 5-triphosphate diphosphatase